MRQLSRDRNPELIIQLLSRKWAAKHCALAVEAASLHFLSVCEEDLAKFYNDK